MTPRALRPSPVIAVTGVGMLTPLGAEVRATWLALLCGSSGVERISEPWAAELPVQIAAMVPGDTASRVGRVEARNLDRNQQFALLAAREAWADAGHPEVEPERLGVAIGTGLGGVSTTLAQWEVVKEHGPKRVSPYVVPMIMPNGAAAAVGLEIGARGGVHTPVSACASGAEAVVLGSDMILSGRVDVAVVGGTEAGIHPFLLSGFAQARALSTRNDEPDRASRPFDKARDGFVMGEGAGVMILERMEHAIARRANITALLLGVGITSDAYHMTAPDPDGTGVTTAIDMAIRHADLSSEDIGHVNAHASSTPVGDISEARAIGRSLGCGSNGVVVTATKSMTGHLLGAAGAVEAIITVLSLTEGQVPAVRNLDDLDDQVDLDVVSSKPRFVSSAAAVSTSLGFGGHNLALVFGKT